MHWKGMAWQAEQGVAQGIPEEGQLIWASQSYCPYKDSMNRLIQESEAIWVNVI